MYAVTIFESQIAMPDIWYNNHDFHMYHHIQQSNDAKIENRGAGSKG